MSRFYITDETVQTAFNWLQENEQNGAIAKAMKVRREDEKKAAKARAFLNADGKNVAEKEAAAILSAEYKSACGNEYEAIKQDEYFRNKRATCAAIIECWRSCQATQRQMAKVG